MSFDLKSSADMFLAKFINFSKTSSMGHLRFGKNLIRPLNQDRKEMKVAKFFKKLNNDVRNTALKRLV